MRSTFKVLFYLKKNAPKKNGSVPVMGCICERRYNCSDAGKGKSAMGFLNEGMDNSTFYAGEDNRHHRHTSLSDKWSSPDVGIFEQMRKSLLV